MATLAIPIQSNPLRRQAMTVCGLTRSSAERQSFDHRESQTHRTRTEQFGCNRDRARANAGFNKRERKSEKIREEESDALPRHEFGPEVNLIISV
jgi:hypothetical protein